MANDSKGMALKKDRHYPETKTVIAITMIVFGICSAICLILIWPQIYVPEVFDSRLSNHLVLGIQDYFTCDSDYVNFVIDEPSYEDSMFIMYVFNVTNMIDVLQRGYKPSLVETGPYGFVRKTLKYDITFEYPESLYVDYKEVTLLSDLYSQDPTACEAMYYRLDREYLEKSPCPGTSCYCKNINETVSVVNPNFLKLLWEDSSQQLIARLSVDVFSQIKTLLDAPFTEAVKAHIVSYSLKEVFLFRTWMQTEHIFQTAYDNLIQVQNMTVEKMATAKLPASVSSCGLSIYKISGCLFDFYSTYSTAISSPSIYNASDFPSILPLYNASNAISFMNFTYGLPRWLGLCWSLGYIDFNSKAGFTMVSSSEMSQVLTDFSYQLALLNFGASGVNSSTIGASKIVVESIAQYITSELLQPYYLYQPNLQSMTYTEFRDTYTPVVCAPLGETCVWQWGFMKKYYHSPYNISDSLAYTLIDNAADINTNPNSFYNDIDAPLYYNDYLYCTKVLPADASFDISCTNYGYTLYDGEVSRPSGLWGIDNGVSTVNLTTLHNSFLKQPSSVQNNYIHFGCNLSYLIQEVYRSQTGFNDLFTVRYLNKYKDPNFNHTFTVGNWSDLGIAQWAGGFVTYSLVNVRTINQIIRNGMWRFGPYKFYVNFMEYSSWAIYQGYPQAYIYSLNDARTLLNALSSRNETAVQLRQHITYAGTTYIGDGIHYLNGVGDIGDITFTREANLGNFSCSGPEKASCDILDVFFESSASYCEEVEQLYVTCTNEYTYNNNKWINFTNCANFETSISSPTLGIQCDLKFIYGHAHPYTKSRGNIVYQMLFSLLYQTDLLEGLWCEKVSGCQFSWGGMFTTTKVKSVLFEGYTEPTILKYLNLKYAPQKISFQCVNKPFDQCGKQLYHCDHNGVLMNLPNGKSFVFRYNETQFDQYFAPELYISNTGDMYWPFAMNQTIANQSQQSMRQANFTTIRNPFWTAYPAWDTSNLEFNKYIQCQKRTLNGGPNRFNSCFERLLTGRDSVSLASQLRSFHGNESIYPFNISLPVNGSLYSQFPMYLWNGFATYPYTYLGKSAGVDYFSNGFLTVFDSTNSIKLVLSQNSLTYSFQKDIPTAIPFDTGPIKTPVKGKFTYTTRRFVEDYSSWVTLKNLGTPRDSYGMVYQIPIGMSSLQYLADFPVYADTAHSYGNALWGGLEYTFVTGLTQNQYSQRTFVDYDPVTGKAYRRAVRQQITLRVEANPMFPIAFSSQQRCVVPTKSYAESSGYGCFAYIPLLWYEDSRLITPREVFKLNDHYYLRTSRGNILTLAGIIIASITITLGACLYVNEAYHKNRFYKRVYVD